MIFFTIKWHLEPKKILYKDFTIHGQDVPLNNLGKETLQPNRPEDNRKFIKKRRNMI
jgi:hypothetical protein